MFNMCQNVGFDLKITQHFGFYVKLVRILVIKGLQLTKFLVLMSKLVKILVLMPKLVKILVLMSELVKILVLI